MVTKGYNISLATIEMSTPNELKPYEDAYNLAESHSDANMWAMGLYFKSALETVLEPMFDKNSKVEYPEKPLFTSYFEESQLTEEELADREIRKMLANEMAWQIVDADRGLPTIK